MNRKYQRHNRAIQYFDPLNLSTPPDPEPAPAPAYDDYEPLPEPSGPCLVEQAWQVVIVLSAVGFWAIVFHKVIFGRGPL